MNVDTSQTAINWLAWIVVPLIVASILGYIFYLRQRSRRRLVRRVAELEALSLAGRAIVAAELDLNALCELIAQQAGHVIDNTTFQIGLFDGSFYEILYWTVNGQQQQTPQRFDLKNIGGHPSDGGLVGWVRDAGQPILVRDFQKEMERLPATPRPRSQKNIPGEGFPRSALFVPLVSGEQTIGIIGVQSLQPNRFGEQDLRRLNIIANQAAAAIANARLFAQERMRAAHLALVGKIAREVNAALDLDELFALVVRLTEETFAFHPVNIFTLDPGKEQMVIRASSGLNGLVGDIGEVASDEWRVASEEQESNARTLSTSQSPISNLHASNGWITVPIGVGIPGIAAATRTTVVSNNTADDERFLVCLDDMPPELVRDTRAEIAIPLVVNDELLGVLDVHSSQIGVFNATEKPVLEALAAEVASAIYKARQLALQQAQAWVATAQLQVAEAISMSGDLDEMLETIARLTPMLSGVSYCGIFLWNEELELYRGSSFSDATGNCPQAFNGLELTLGMWGALDAVHVGQEPITTWQLPNVVARACRPLLDDPQHPLLLYPILGSQEQTVGVLLVDACYPPQSGNGFELGSERGTAQRQEELLRNIAHQTGQAVESIWLRTAQQEEAWVNTALLKVAEAVNNLVDLNEILDTIVRLVPMLVGVDAVLILVWDEMRQVFYPGPTYGISPMGRGLIDTLHIDGEEFLRMTPELEDMDTAVERAPTHTYYPIRMSGWLRTILNNASVAFNFPLIARGRLVGAMIVGRAEANAMRFSSRRLNILNGIAQQAATAVVNNQLYRESAERLRLQQELDVAQKIQTSFLPDKEPNIPGCSVASFWQAARQVSGDFYDFLPLSGGRWGIAIADVADKGVPAALFMALSRTILRTVAFTRSDPAQVLMRTNEIIGKEARSDLFVTIFYGVWEPATERFIYANAGHNPPLLMRPNGRFNELPGHGIALGVLPEIEMDSYAVHLRPGETIILYTDGVTEALNEDYDEFGMQRLRVAASGAARLNAPGIVGRITDSIRDHAGDSPQFDDITLIVMKRQKSE